MSDQNQPRPELAEIQNLPVQELADRLEGLSADDLAQLRELEAGSEKPRTGALQAIDAAAKALEPPADDSNPPAPPPAAAKPSTAKPAAAKAPAWQDRDYDGPLTIPQAEWRRHNVKPVREARTK